MNDFESIPFGTDRQGMIDGYSIPSILHCLFDAYLPPDLGSASTEAQHFFVKMLDTFVSESFDIKDLFDNSFQVQNLFNQNSPKKLLGRLSLPVNFDTSRTSIPYIANQYYSKLIGTVDVLKDKPQSTYFTLEYTADNTERIVSNEKFIYDFCSHLIWIHIPLMSDIISKPKKYISNYPLAQINELILSSGWVSKQGGHLIGFYFKKTGPRYLYGFFNSGDDIDHHDKSNDKCSVYCLFEGKKEQLVEMLSFVLL